MTRIRSADWKSLGIWAVGVSLGLLCLGLLIRSESSRHLQASSEVAGLSWARFAARTVPDLAQVFAGSGVSPEARAQLLLLRKSDSVFRFKLFNADGDLILTSDDLATDRPISRKPGADGIGEHHGVGDKAHIRRKLLSGVNHIELKRERRADRPTVYSEAYVPVMQDDRMLGVVEVYVDLAAEAQTIANAFFRVAVAAATLLLLASLIFGYQFWLRLRRQRQAEERVHYMAHHDTLSGALNRGSFNDLLAQACARAGAGGLGFALLCIDLDRFKDVNDQLGHAAGDEVLRVVTQRLREALRDGDAIARLGGDEFAVLLPGVTTAAAVEPLARRIVGRLAQPYDAAGSRVSCGGSVGAAICGLDGTEPVELLHKADLALYQAKAAGRGTFCFYDEATEMALKVRRGLSDDLQKALAAGQLSLHYQPLYESNKGMLTGYEALLRWQHPERGNVPPIDFIPLAEETGFIDTLGQWVLNRACADAAGWPDPLTAAVNLSPSQLVHGDLAEQVRKALYDSGLPAHRLQLEITESMLMENTDQVMSQLQELAAMGVSIAMDDFGTGYSSLAYLWRFPFDKVKIDRAFTQHLDDDPKVNLIVRSIITLAHSLGIRVNAEGVETAAQMAALQAEGCDELQGFLLGRPAPLALLSHKDVVVTNASTRQARSRTGARESLFADLPELVIPGQRPE